MTATFDKKTELQADVVLTVTGAPITAVKNGASVVNVLNYTIVGTTLTIKKEYLASLTDGAKTFSILSSSDTEAVTITVQTTA